MLKDDLNYKDIKKIQNQIHFKKRNQEFFKREMKHVSNHIEKMLTESKKLRDGKPFISELKMYNNDNKKNKMMKIFTWLHYQYFLFY